MFSFKLIVVGEVTVPWKSVWPSSYPEFNWDSNSKTYPGHGHNNDWFHCTSGTRNIIARQQSVAFTNPYTDPSKDKAGFVTTDTSFPADAASKKVGVQASQATTTYFMAQVGSLFSDTATVSVPRRVLYC